MSGRKVLRLQSRCKCCKPLAVATISWPLAILGTFCKHKAHYDLGLDIGQKYVLAAVPLQALQIYCCGCSLEATFVYLPRGTVEPKLGVDPFGRSSRSRGGFWSFLHTSRDQCTTSSVAEVVASVLRGSMRWAPASQQVSEPNAEKM